MRVRFIAFLVCWPMLLAGCADSNEAVVTGTVLVDGEPASSGSYLTFIPLDGMSATAGAQIVDGQYTARVPVGTMKVKITVPKVVGETRLYDTPDSPVQQITAETLPPRYSSEDTELRLDVKPGENRQDYDLKSD